MTDFDGYAYEREQGSRLQRAAQTLLAMPEFIAAVDSYGRGPTVVLLCPRGHKLLPVITDVHDGGITVTPLPGHKARKSGRVTAYGEPWRHLTRRVCRKPGCPALVDYDGYCDQHGGAELEEIGGVRTIFTCRSPKCAWSQPVTTARLLQRYGRAVRLGRGDIPLGDTAG